MKNIIKLLLICAASQSIAGLETNVVYPYNDPEITTTKITGDVSISDSSEYKNLWLKDGNLTLATGGKNFTVSSTGKNLSVGEGSYIMAVEGNSSIEIKNGAKLILYGSANMGVMRGTENFEITIESNGVLRAKKLFSNATKMTLNLETAYAFNQQDMVVGAAGGQREIVFNISADQKFGLNSRADSVYSLNITNGSTFTVSGVSLLSDGANGTVTFKVSDGLKNGALMFLKDESNFSNDYSWNEKTSELTMKVTSALGETQKSQIAKFVDAEGHQLTNVVWKPVEGGYTLMALTVPEPAEWAAIFGTLALAFAIYRRRK